eukprot:augustus_masked-scaffold_4-processed-gene-15.36-mRNA-1 protein AED:1.00 eAED:1.00 QI:0/0/0/0/1/1/2/0/774
MEFEKLKLSASQAKEKLRIDLEKKYEGIINLEKKTSLSSMKNAQNEFAKELTDLKSTTNERIKTLETRLMENIDKNIKNEKEISSLEAENEKLKNKLNIETSSSEVNSAEVVRLRENNSGLTSKLTLLSNENTKLEVTNGSLAEQIKDKTESLNKTMELYNGLKEKMKAFEQKLVMYKESTKKLQEKLQDSINEIHKGNSFISNLQNDIKSLKLKLKNRNLVIKQQEKYVDKLKHEVESKEREKFNLEAALNNEKLATTQLKDILKVRDEKLKSYEQVMDSNKNVINYLNKEINKHEIEPLDMDLGNKKMSYDRLETNPGSNMSIFTQMMQNYKIDAGPEPDTTEDRQDSSKYGDLVDAIGFDALPDPENFEYSSLDHISRSSFQCHDKKTCRGVDLVGSSPTQRKKGLWVSYVLFVRPKSFQPPSRLILKKILIQCYSTGSNAILEPGKKSKMEEINEKTNNLSISEEEANQLPADLLDLIDNAEEEIKSKPILETTTITTKTFIAFLIKTIDKLNETTLTETIAEELEKNENERINKNPNLKLGFIREKLSKSYEETWESLGIDPALGAHCLNNLHRSLSNPRLPEESKKQLVHLLNSFKSAEEKFIGINLLGKKAYDKRQTEKKVVTELKQEMLSRMARMSNTEKGRYIIEIKDRGMEFRKKLMAMSKEEALKFMDKLSEQEQKTLHELTALTMIMQEKGMANRQGCGHDHGHGGHGHSHDNHGHSHQDQGHSHESHGHSHEHHGHSHESHGHSHVATEEAGMSTGNKKND